MSQRKTITDGGGSFFAKNISNYFNTGDYSNIEFLNASYLVIFDRDESISQSILNYGNEESFLVEEAFLFDLLDESKTNDLELVYKNNRTKIFKLGVLIITTCICPFIVP